MPFDGLTIHALVEELNPALENARIDKIHQPEKDELVLSLRHPRSGSARLVISTKPRWARLHLSTDKRPNPTSPPSFCMLLRKYLEGGKIVSFQQINFDRIVHITIEALDDFREWKPRLLICELMGRHSNIILVNPETGLIMDALKKFGSESNSCREILPGKEYLSPPAQNKLNPLTISPGEFYQAMWQQSGKKVSTAVFETVSGISPFSSRQICGSVQISPDYPVDECGEYELSTLYQQINRLVEKPDYDLTGYILYQGEEPLEFAPYPITILDAKAPTSIIETPSINQACDYFYRTKLDLMRLDSTKVNLSRQVRSWLEKSCKKLFHQESDQAQAKSNDIYRTWGELLTTYAHQLQKGLRQAALQDFYTGEMVDIALDPRFTPIQNAQRYFKTYNKSRTALIHLEKLIADTREEINYLESVLVAIDQAENRAQIAEIVEELEKEGYLKGKRGRSKTKPEKSQPRKYVSSDGYEIWVGRNNRQNDVLTLKLADRHDLWLHTKEIPGTHVIIRLPNKSGSIEDIPDSTLEEAAILAAYFSKGNQSEKVAVDYTFRANVHKPSGAKPGMVIYENYWTILVNPHSQQAQTILSSGQEKI
ncbi:Rqc2 family fibronectin-binding protein [Syntrophomonas erecta]